jgi:phosphopantothenoylcysteine decarboxylase/phosphopantothenate--cysteine ligase
MYLLNDRKLLLCVGGGIAAYKCAELVRLLTGAGATVQVAMTGAAARFVSPLTLQTLSGNPVATDLLDASQDATVGHIRLADEADAVLVAPATADLLARLAFGITNDVVTAAVLATRAPVVIAPSMNVNMYSHPAVRANIKTLEGYGYSVLEPDSGELACGWEGQGRLPDPEDLADGLAACFVERDLEGMSVLVSAGPSREALDPVRYISNRSSGRMGYALAAAARRRGAAVTLVSGPSSLRPPRDCSLVDVETAEDFREQMLDRAVDADVVMMVAAVADYAPGTVAKNKIKKGDAQMRLELVKTPDVLSLLGERARRPNSVLVGFAAETENLAANALAKLQRKKLDLVVANDVSGKGGGFDSTENAALIIDRDGKDESTGSMSKDELADRILDRVVALRQPAAASSAGA